MKKEYLLMTLNYPGIGGIERSFEILEKYLLMNEYKTLIFAYENVNNKDKENIYSFKYSFFHKILIFEPLKTYFSFKKNIKESKLSFDNKVIISRWLPISFALDKLNIKHTYIPPAVSEVFFDGIINNIKKEKKSFFIKNLKLLKWRIVKKIYQKLEEKILKSKNVKIITFSKNVKDNLLESNNFKRHIDICPPGIDNDNFYVISDDIIQREKEKLFINKDDFVVLYVGRLSAGKNIKLLIDSFNLLSIENKKLILIGEGEFLIEKTSSILTLGKKSLKELKVFYNIANVTVLPTTNEGFGQVFVESLGCGTPIVGFDTNKSAVSEIITKELFGIKTQEITDLGLSKVINEIYNKKEFYLENKLFIEKEAKLKFNWLNLIEKISK